MSRVIIRAGVGFHDSEHLLPAVENFQEPGDMIQQAFASIAFLMSPFPCYDEKC